jgi:hypothetical protein
MGITPGIRPHQRVCNFCFLHYFCLLYSRCVPAASIAAGGTQALSAIPREDDALHRNRRDSKPQGLGSP